ncbi:MAG: glycoside hydrolase family 127 protein [Planctomycetes bacterium]|nr:glycoside hydrolase family 127 protein [Planctomycetota bacterium]MBL7039116.1 glycoside hydrolase family 127 protein [Pirellulaceae bacterium]
MKTTKHLARSLTIFALVMCSLAAAEEKHDYPLAPMSFEKVTLQDNFWLPRLKLQAESTVPHALVQTEPAVENLRRCGNFLHGRGGELPFPHRFVSSDLYKVMEGAAYLLMIKPDPGLEKQLDGIIDVIAEAQQDDGYLYVSHICGVARPQQMGETPYSWVVHSHELYNLGHMYEGAIAYYQATGKDKWLKVAEKSARHFNKVFFEGDPNYSDGRPVMQAPGHQELELALCKLYRVTGKRLYLDMAQKFLDVRGVTYRPEGEGTMSPSYAQQHKPVVEQTQAVGHAVRAGYLYAGMADMSALTGDMSYAGAAEKIWHDIVDTKMHIIGGLGATHGIEGFGPAYDLPNRQTYNETCAAVANVLFNFRMYLLHQDAKYFDVAEVALLNNSLAGMGMAGDSFFYVNVLETDGVPMFNHGSGGRAEWFGCACCPSNLARLIPQVSGYMYSHTDDEICLGLYGSSRTEIPLAGGNVTIEQESNYPFDGRVRLKIDPTSNLAFVLKLRIPTWARGQFVPGALYQYIDGLQPKWTLKVNGQAVDASPTKGFAAIQRIWQAGDTVELNLPMPVRYSKAIDQVEANRDRIAITRGPLVYCAEQADNLAAAKLHERADIVQRFYVPGPADPAEIETDVIDGGLLQGVVRVSVPAMELTDNSVTPSALKLIPYYAWNNRGEDSMIVWLPRNESLARQFMVSNQLSAADYGKVIATHTHESDSVAAVVDGRVPDTSDDQEQPRWTGLPFKNRGQNIIVEFDHARTVGSIAVYWYEEDGGEGEKVRLPRNWWVEYRVGEGEWTKMKKYITDDYGLDRDKFNVVRPTAPLKCDAISIRILPQVGFCMGVHEVQLQFDDGK